MQIVITDGGRRTAGFPGKAPGDCVTRAIAIATGKPYRVVYNALAHFASTERRGRRKRRISHPRTGVHIATWKRYVRSLGWIWHGCTKIGEGCKVHLRESELPAGRLIVQCSRHVTCVIDRVIYDLYDPSRQGTRQVYGYFTAPAPLPGLNIREMRSV
jgi:hypothetical protein